MVTTLCTWFLYLVFYSFVGWLCETVYCSIGQRKLADRGFLNGPVCPIYGFGALGVVLLLRPVQQSPAAVFVLGMVLTSALASVSDEYYKAARVDGTSRMRIFFRITLPMLKPTVMFVMIISMINSFQAFDQIYIMTKGGPAGATRTIGYYIYSNAFKRFDFGYAAALSTALFVIIMLLTLLQWYGQKRWVYYD